MVREKTDKEVSGKEKNADKVEIKHEQLQLFAAFCELWQAQVP